MQKENYEMAVSNYAEDIYRMAFSMVQAKEDAEDILQNVFMKLLLCCIFSRQPFVPDYRGHVNF